ncbi:hypothetical protein [Actomonas aquatica]|uniref:Alginate biosynthesis protein AlgF n=1 Tax=Actomonas aquatica TaxID=2866162 RepID=A0ABZ1C9F5_9BACT|nr:hypothetical protein [Opitutus sp. WL0086]WRQ88128.1 hypothetical protein K1X11_001830 [Opitutus sp. WL0086]
MVTFTRRLIIVAAAACSFTATAIAQQPKPARQFEFSVFCIAPVRQTLVYQASPGEVRTLEFKPYQRSEPYRYAGPAAMAFAERVAEASAQTPAQYKLQSRIEVTPELQRPLFLFLPSSDPNEPFDVVVMEDDPSRFPAGSLVVVNQSGHKLLGLLNGQNVSLEPGQSSTLHGTVVGDVKLALSHNDRLFPSFDQKVAFEKDERTVLLLLPPQRKSSPIVRWIVLTDRPG